MSETTKHWLAVVDFVLVTSFFTYMFTGVVLLISRAFGASVESKPLKPFNLVWKWAKYPALGHAVGAPVLTVLIAGHLTFWDYLSTAVNVYVWWQYRDVGDDDWKKKLKKKVTEIVKAVQGRLIVVPQGA